MDTGQILIGVAVGVLVTLTCQSRLANAFARFGSSSMKNVADGKGYVKMVLVVRNDLGMGKGKIAAQCSHAAVGCYRKKESPFLKSWLSQGQPKIVVKCDKPGEEALYELATKARYLNVPHCVIHDAGHTQVASGTATVIGLGPATSELLDQISGHLKLL